MEDSQKAFEDSSSGKRNDVLLTSNQAKNVRFTKKKNGYAYDQVETFLDQIIQTLEFVENKMLEDHELLNEAKLEIKSQEETIANLKATIEVFRARGDVLTNQDGSFATSSSAANEAQQLRKRVAELEKLLDESRKDADAGWAAESELRSYVENQLQPWLNRNSG